jgi:hypothetical protein
MAATPALAAPAPAAPAPAPPKRSHPVRNVVVIVVVVVVVVLVALLAIPISTPYSYSVTATYSTNGVATLSPPSGAKVSGTFTTTDGDSVTFEILDSGHSTVYSDDASYGSFSFTASNPPYTFEAITTILSHTVDISGHYTAPLL